MFIRRSARFLACLTLATVTTLGTIASQAHAAGIQQVVDPTGTYQLPVPTDWQVQSDAHTLFLYAPDGNLAILGLALQEGSHADPLKANLAKLPEMLKLGRSEQASAVRSRMLGGIQIQYGTVTFLAKAGGTQGMVMAVRGYDRGQVIYLVGAIKDLGSSGEQADVQLMAYILGSARFA